MVSCVVLREGAWAGRGRGRGKRCIETNNRQDYDRRWNVTWNRGTAVESAQTTLYIIYMIS